MKKEILNGVQLIDPLLSEDNRGSFIKIFNRDWYLSLESNFNEMEEYYSISKKNVIRGMHFQKPPHDYTKIVHCIKGRALDVVLDLRKSSSTYGMCKSFEISSKNKKIVCIPPGFAHGFMSLEDDTIILYKVSSVYSKSNDVGIHWNSFGFKWPCNSPVISARDQEHPKFASNWQSPFR